MPQSTQDYFIFEMFYVIERSEIPLIRQSRRNDAWLLTNEANLTALYAAQTVPLRYRAMAEVCTLRGRASYLD